MSGPVVKPVFSRFKKKPKPIPQAKRFKDLGVEEKLNCGYTLQTNSNLIDTNCDADGTVSHLIEQKQNLSETTASTNLFISPDCLNKDANCFTALKTTTATTVAVTAVAAPVSTINTTKGFSTATVCVPSADPVGNICFPNNESDCSNVFSINICKHAETASTNKNLDSLNNVKKNYLKKKSCNQEQTGVITNYVSHHKKMIEDSVSEAINYNVGLKMGAESNLVSKLHCNDATSCPEFFNIEIDPAISPSCKKIKNLTYSEDFMNSSSECNFNGENLINFRGTSCDLAGTKFYNKKISDLSKSRSKSCQENEKKRTILRDFIYLPRYLKKNRTQAAEERCNIDRFESVSDDDCSASESISAAPQIKLSGDGKLIIDPDSINVCPFNKKLKKIKKQKIVSEDEYSSRLKIMKCLRKRNKDTLTSLFSPDETKTNTYSRYWTLEETLKFYIVLNEFGSDFSVMLEAFPYRTRKQLKRKFLHEEKVRVKYIDLAMKKRDSIDFKKLEKELKRNCTKKEKKAKEKLIRIEKEKEFERRMVIEYKPSVGRKKVKLNSEVPFENGIHYLGRIYNEKEKMIKRCIKQMKTKYLDLKENESKKGKNNCGTYPEKRYNRLYKNQLKKSCFKAKGKKSRSDSESDIESLRFDISNQLCKKISDLKQQQYDEAVEDSFIREIKTEDDLDLFFSISSKMYCYLGNKWKIWVKNEIINQLLTREDSDAKRAAIEIKAAEEEKEKLKQLEKSYQIYTDPFDYPDPFLNYGNFEI